MRPIVVQPFPSPAGELLLGDFDGQVVLCDWSSGERFMANSDRVLLAFRSPFEFGDSPLLRRLRKELREYFAGRRRTFDLPVRHSGTPFETRVWDELRRIPYGATISYGELARRIGNPSATRAVAGANARNPVSILVPCHRVIAADGGLGGYGGGLAAKRLLLDLERDPVRLPSRPSSPCRTPPPARSESGR